MPSYLADPSNGWLRFRFLFLAPTSLLSFFRREFIDNFPVNEDRVPRKGSSELLSCIIFPSFPSFPSPLSAPKSRFPRSGSVRSCRPRAPYQSTNHFNESPSFTDAAIRPRPSPLPPELPTAVCSKQPPPSPKGQKLPDRALITAIHRKKQIEQIQGEDKIKDSHNQKKTTNKYRWSSALLSPQYHRHFFLLILFTPTIYPTTPHQDYSNPSSQLHHGLLVLRSFTTISFRRPTLQTRTPIYPARRFSP